MVTAPPPDAQDRHIPVKLDRVLETFAPALDRPAPIVVDATLGLGGHTIALLTTFPHAVVIGVDRDPAALERAIGRARTARVADRLVPVRAVYDDIARICAAAREAREAARARHDVIDGDSPAADGDAAPFAAVLFDLGVSSMQLDRAERGFAYSVDAPLDMRMDPDDPLTAGEIVNTYPERELARILRDYGEERFAARIARRIVRARTDGPLTSSARLVDLLREAIPAAARRTGGHPAKRTFQALRIAVNDELGALSRAVPAALDALAPGGRIVALSYQSLEDRIVKRAIAPRTVSTTPPGLPVELAGHEPTFRWLTRGAETADAAEIDANPRSAPVRMRAAERIRRRP